MRPRAGYAGSGEGRPAITDAAEWTGRVGESWAEEWRRTDRSLAPVGDALVSRILSELQGIERPALLDVGCGAGATSLALAKNVSGATIIGVDISETLVATARQRAGDHFPDLDFVAADAARWTPGIRPLDAVVSRHGVMFFADPARAFTHFQSLTRPGGSLVFSCFRRREENHWATCVGPVMADFAPDHGLPPAAGPFAFADPDRVGGILTEAGFTALAFEPLDFDFIAGEGADPVADALSYFARIGPLAAAMRELSPDRRDAAMANLENIVAARAQPGRVSFPGAAWIVCARA